MHFARCSRRSVPLLFFLKSGLSPVLPRAASICLSESVRAKAHEALPLLRFLSNAVQRERCTALLFTGGRPFAKPAKSALEPLLSRIQTRSRQVPDEASCPPLRALRPIPCGTNHGNQPGAAERRTAPGVSPFPERQNPGILRCRGSALGSLTMSYFHWKYNQLSSAIRRFTVLFGMGRSGTVSLWSSGKGFVLADESLEEKNEAFKLRLLS
jgi:hypothetical protein